MYSPKIAPALVSRLHTMDKVLAIPMTGLVNWLFTEGLDRFLRRPPHPRVAGLHRNGRRPSLARLVRLSARFIRQHLPLPQLRVFTWLQTAEATS